MRLGLSQTVLHVILNMNHVMPNKWHLLKRMVLNT